MNSGDSSDDNLPITDRKYIEKKNRIPKIEMDTTMFFEASSSMNENNVSVTLYQKY